MDHELETPAIERDASEKFEAADKPTYRISAQPVIDRKNDEQDSPASDLPRSYGTETLTLMARDPRTLFAYWDIDWPAAFREETPRHQKVYLRILDASGTEIISVEVEPMAGNSYVTVPEADSAYQGEIGYFNPLTVWNPLAASTIVTTPADTVAGSEAADFATVPFHLSFQHMIDLLRISKQENESLTSMLADLRERASSEKQRELSAGEREIAQAMDAAAANSPMQTRTPASSDFWTQQRIERVLGIGGSSPANGFGGSSRAL